MAHLSPLPVPITSARNNVAGMVAAATPETAMCRLSELIAANRASHEQTALDLNPASNVMNPAAETFAAPFVEIRVPSGSIANLYALMATTRPGETIIAPPVPARKARARRGTARLSPHGARVAARIGSARIGSCIAGIAKRFQEQVHPIGNPTENVLSQAENALAIAANGLPANSFWEPVQ